MKWFAFLFALLLCTEIFISHEAAAWRRRRRSSRRRRFWRSVVQGVKKVANKVKTVVNRVINYLKSCPLIPVTVPWYCACPCVFWQPGRCLYTIISGGCPVLVGRRKRSAESPPMVADEGFTPQDASRLKLMTCSLAELFSQRGECAQHRRRHKKDIKAVQDVLDESNRLLSILKTLPGTAEALRKTTCSGSLPGLSACPPGYPGTLPTKLMHESDGTETDLTPCRIDPVDEDRDLTWQECDQRGVAGLVRQDYILAYLLGDVERLVSQMSSNTTSPSEPPTLSWHFILKRWSWPM